MKSELCGFAMHVQSIKPVNVAHIQQTAGLICHRLVIFADSCHSETILQVVLPSHANMTASHFIRARLLLLAAALFVSETGWLSCRADDSSEQEIPGGTVRVPVARSQRDTGVESALTDEEKEIVLDAHNKYRSETTPSASNMIALVSNFVAYDSFSIVQPST